MTSKDLRTLMSTELDTLAPMPDLVPQVIRQGATQVRRRRLAVGGLVAAAAIGGVAIAPWASGRSQGADSQPADGGGNTAAPSDVPTPSPMPQGGNLVLDDPEVMAAFDAALPDRFSQVRVMQESSVYPAPLATNADGTQLRIQVELAQGKFAALERCAELAEAGASGTCNGGDVYDIPPSATRRTASDGLHTVTGLRSRRPWFVTVRFAAGQPVPLSDAEVLELLTHPKFLAMLDSRDASDFVPADPPTPSTTPVPTDPAPTEMPEPADTTMPPTPVPTEEPETESTFPDPEPSDSEEPTPVPTDPGPPSPTPQPTRPPATTEPPAATPAPTAG